MVSEHHYVNYMLSVHVFRITLTFRATKSIMIKFAPFENVSTYLGKNVF